MDMLRCTILVDAIYANTGPGGGAALCTVVCAEGTPWPTRSAQPRRCSQFCRQTRSRSTRHEIAHQAPSFSAQTTRRSDSGQSKISPEKDVDKQINKLAFVDAENVDDDKENTKRAAVGQ